MCIIVFAIRYMIIIVDGQNSWELGGVKMRIFEGYFGKSDKIDGNWVWCCKLARKLKMTK